LKDKVILLKVERSYVCRKIKLCLLKEVMFVEI
jgi:hypothetical protein